MPNSKQTSVTVKHYSALHQAIHPQQDIPQAISPKSNQIPNPNLKNPFNLKIKYFNKESIVIIKIRVLLMDLDWIRETLLCLNGLSLINLINLKIFGLRIRLTIRNYRCGINLFITDAGRHLGWAIKYDSLLMRQLKAINMSN